MKIIALLKTNRIIAFLVLVIILLLILVLRVNNQYSKAISKVNEYDSSKFFSIVSYFWQIDELLSTNRADIIKSDIDSEITRIQDSLVAINEIIADYNYIYSKNIQKPDILILWLTNMKSDLMRYKNENKFYDNNSLDILKTKLKEINKISSSVYNYNNGLTTDQWKELNKKGFFEDGRWMTWLTEVNGALQ